MKNTLFILALCALLTGCAGSPIAISHMDADQIRTVTDRQLCKAYNNNYVAHSPELTTEIRRRKIECDPAILDCENQGFKKGTHDMLECVAEARQAQAAPAAGFQPGSINPVFRAYMNPADVYCAEHQCPPAQNASPEEKSAYQQIMQQRIYEQNQQILQNQQNQQMQLSMPQNYNCMNMGRGMMNCTGQ